MQQIERASQSLHSILLACLECGSQILHNRAIYSNIAQLFGHTLSLFYITQPATSIAQCYSIPSLPKQVINSREGMCDETISEYIQRTHNPSPLKRKRALKELCPCHVQQDIPEVWERVFEMLQDESGIVRDQVQCMYVYFMHKLCGDR